MYAGNDLQAVQLLPGGSYVTVSSSVGNWRQRNTSSSSGRSSKGSRGGSAGKGKSVSAHSLTPLGCEVAYIDATTGNLMTSSGSQAFSRHSAQQPSGQQAPVPQTQAPTVMQVHSFQQNGQQLQAQQVLQLHSAPAGPQTYNITNGTRVVKAGQPYPNTTIVQTAVAVPTNPQQQPQQQLGVITMRQQNVPPPQQQALQQQVQGTMGSSIQIAASGPAQQQQQQPQGQPAKVVLLQQPAPTQPHVLVAQPQKQLIIQQQHTHQQPQQLQGKLQQQRPAPAPVAFQTVALRSPGPTGPGGTTIRPVGNGPITLQTVYAPPPAVTTVLRPAVRIPKLGTVATYNPMTGVRSATTTNVSGGAAVPMMPASLPTALVQQVQKVNLLQQQSSGTAVSAAGGAGGLKTVLTMQPQLHGPSMQPAGPVSTAMGNTTAPLVSGGSQQQYQQQQRHTTLVVAGVTGSGSGLAATLPAPPTHLGTAVVGGSLQQAQQQVIHTSQHIQMVTAAGGPQVHPSTQQQQQLAQSQSQQQVVNITLADGTTATTVMDQATLTRMLSESSRGQAAKLQQQRQLLQPGQSTGVSAGSIQVQVQAQTLQQQQPQQQVLLQTAPQLTVPGLLTVLSAGGSGGKGRGGSNGNGGLEHLNGGLQTVHLASSAPAAVSGPAQVLIMGAAQASSSVAGGTTRGLLPPSGLSQVARLRTVQMLGPSAGVSSLHQADTMLGAQQPLLQLQQPPDQQLQSHVQLLQLQQQASLGRRPSGRGLAGDVEAPSSSATLLEPSSLTFGQLQALGGQRLQQQQLHSVVEGLSVVDLGASLDQQQNLRHPQPVLGAMPGQHLQPDAMPSPIQSGGGPISGSNVSLLHGSGVNSGRLEPASGLFSSPEGAAASVAMAAVNMAPGGGGEGAAVTASPFSSANSGSGSCREDLKAILVSIGQELARHGISVETAVTSGWLGLLTAMDVAVLADAYTDEERHLVMQQKAQSQPASQPPQQHSAAAQLGVRSVGDGALSQGQAAANDLGPGGSGGSSGSSGERGSTATAGILNLTSSSARTSMSVAPSEDGASTASGGVCSGTELSAGGSHVPGAAGGLHDLSKFNPFQYGFLSGGMMSVGGDLSSELEKLPAGGLDIDKDTDTGAMAEVFGEKTWPPFSMPVMAEEIGLSAQPHLHGVLHAFPPAHASALLDFRGDGRGGSSNAAAKIIDSASEYEARVPVLQSQQHQQHQQRQHQPGVCAGGGGRLSTPELHPLHFRGISGGGGAGKTSGTSAPTVMVGNGGAGGMSKGYSSAPGDMVSTAGASGPGTAVDLDKEIENRFANLDLGCGFY
ncbi:hypothetical protein VaNZ11_014769 [Volvox africanus]|uniref:GLTSCR protein conserved domain-containing protein n=1 Tax=Volvox africanus TaxID=51714 RepID=A0ABQ5SJ97_9CHLO|nr:hypothetical protein VaNZ11_014769 [Volvox africanus]